ncbi:MAG: hypothetical protein ACRDJU_02790 [Actinomycetota bacterium]
MRRVITAFTIGLGMGLSITAVRVVVRARKGLPTTWNTDRPAIGNGATQPNGVAVGNGQLATRHSQAYRGPSFSELLERLRVALADGAQAMHDTEAELRSSVFGGK